MCLINKFNKAFLVIGQLALAFVIGILHIVFGYLIEVNEFKVFDLFDSSPLFDFLLSNDCWDRTSITFHRWGGRGEIETNTEEPPKMVVYDETDIKIINGNYFCYKYKSYRDLLYNGQIIKKGSKCPSKYPKNCGI